jgi:hypothetical protein
VTNFDLQIAEDKLDAFEAWLAHAHPTSSRKILSFKAASKGAVVYTVHVSCKTLQAAVSTRERWGLDT